MALWNTTQCLLLTTVHWHTSLHLLVAIFECIINQFLAHLYKNCFQKMSQNKKPPLSSMRSQAFSDPISPTWTYFFIKFPYVALESGHGRGMEHPDNHSGREPQSHSLTSGKTEASYICPWSQYTITTININRCIKCFSINTKYHGKLHEPYTNLFAQKKTNLSYKNNI